MELLRKREGDYHLWLKNSFSGGSFGLMPCHESGTFHYKLQTNFEGVSYYRFIEGGSLVDQGICLPKDVPPRSILWCVPAVPCPVPA